MENENLKDFGEEVYSRKVRAGKRTYFVDVKRTRRLRDFYITITESKRIGEIEYEKHKIFIYKEDLDKFMEALSATIDYIHTETGKESTPASQDVKEEKTVNNLDSIKAF